jgi:hypothetical protein
LAFGLRISLVQQIDLKWVSDFGIGWNHQNLKVRSIFHEALVLEALQKFISKPAFYIQFMQRDHAISGIFSEGITEIRCAANPTGFTDSKRVGVKFFGFLAISSGTSGSVRGTGWLSAAGWVEN